jgi:hypothetical protein
VLSRGIPTAADCRKFKYPTGTVGFIVVYTGYPPEFITRDLLLKDLPDHVLSFESGNPLR